MSESRKRNDERALEKEEEDYFNEDRYVSVSNNNDSELLDFLCYHDH